MEKLMVRTEDIIWRRIGDEIVVIQDDGMSVHVLNKTAAYIWELCDGTRGTGEITDSLCERFDVGIEEARVDVQEILERLSQIGILNHSQEATGQ